MLKPNGSVAFWVSHQLNTSAARFPARPLSTDAVLLRKVYGTNFLPQHHDLWPMMAEFMSSKSDFLGPYWPQPGRNLLENLLNDV